MANDTLVNLALKNKIMERNQAQQHRLLVDGLQMAEEDQLYFSDNEEEEFYTENHNNHTTAEHIYKVGDLQMAEDDLYFSDSDDEEFYNENTPHNNLTTVFPLTLQSVYEFQASVDDNYGPNLILRKFLTSLSECESDTHPYNQFAACDEAGLQGHHLLDDLDNESEVFWSISEVGTIYESDGEEWTTDQETGHSKCESEMPHNKLTACFVVKEPHMLHDLDIDGEEWTTKEDAENHPDGDRMEERLAVLSSSVPLPQVQSDCAAEEGFQILDSIKMDQSSDFATDLKEVIQLLDPIEVDQQSDFSTEEVIQLLDPIESGCSTDEVFQLLDPLDPDQHSDCGTEEEFHLLDPMEVPMLWGEGIIGPKVVTTKRLSRYELHYGPKHRIRSPSRPVIGARGDSRERSLVNGDDFELPSLPNLDPECHQGKDTGARTKRGPRVKTAAPKTRCCSFHRDPIVSLPSPGCPWWLLLMGLPSLLTATVAVVQKLGKLLEGGQPGQPHRQPPAQQETVITSANVPDVKHVLCCPRLPCYMMSVAAPFAMHLSV